MDYEPFTTGETITKALAEHNIWLASTFTPFRKLYKAGDRALLYVAGAGYRHFVGEAEIAGPTTKANAEDMELAISLGLDGFTEKIPLQSATLWKKALLLRPLVQDLAFIKDKQNYGLNLRQAAARIGAADYRYIVGHATSGT